VCAVTSQVPFAFTPDMLALAKLPTASAVVVDTDVIGPAVVLKATVTTTVPSELIGILEQPLYVKAFQDVSVNLQCHIRSTLANFERCSDCRLVT
jgi:hypothetical protein